MSNDVLEHMVVKSAQKNVVSYKDIEVRHTAERVDKMPITIKEIASLAGVSRGTVDRVLHNRSNVSPEVRERVEKILKDLEYQPNSAAAALKGVTRKITLGVIVPDLRNEFFVEVYAGINAAARRFRGYGITTVEYRMRESTDTELIRGIEYMMERRVDGIALQAIESDAVQACVDALPEKFPVVTFNSDFTNGRRLCFVGQDAYAAGRVAGQMMAMLLRRSGKIAVIIGHARVAAQRVRADGFCQVMKEQLPDVSVLGPLQAEENEEKAYRIVSKVLSEEPELVGIYAAGGGQKSVAAALADSGRAQEVIMVGHDLLPKTVEYLNQNVVNCTIAQEPYYQGYLPVEILAEYLMFGTRPAEKLLTSIDIRIRDNVAFNGCHSIQSANRRDDRKEINP